MRTLVGIALLLVGCGGARFTESLGPTDGGGGDAPQTADAGDDAGDGAGRAVAAVDDAAETAPACITDLSNIGTGDFRVSFALTTTATTAMALANQSSVCQQACGGAASVEWDVTMTASGSIEIETDDGAAADRVFEVGGGPVNDGRPHSVVAARTGGSLWVQTDDGARSELAPDTNALGALPPLVVGSDPCASSTGGAGCPSVRPLAGTLTDLCVTR